MTTAIPRRRVLRPPPAAPANPQLQVQRERLQTALAHERENLRRWMGRLKRALGSGDKTVRLWNLRSREVGTNSVVLKGHEGGVGSLAFSPDGKWLATGSENTARLWDLKRADVGATSVVLKEVGSGSDGVYVAISPDGKWLATRRWLSQNPRLWDLKSADVAASSVDLKGHESYVESLAFSPDGKWLATGSEDMTARLWDLNNASIGASSVQLKGHGRSVGVSFSPDGKFLVTSDEDTVRLWDTDINRLISRALLVAGRSFTVEERKTYGLNDVSDWVSAFWVQSRENLEVLENGISRMLTEVQEQKSLGFDEWEYLADNKATRGVFRRGSGNIWTEYKNERYHATFEEIGRTSTSILLYDSSRKIWVSLTSTTMSFSWDRVKWNTLYQREVPPAEAVKQ